MQLALTQCKINLDNVPGLKYERENEDDLKDKLDFVAPAPQHYPDGGECQDLCQIKINFCVDISNYVIFSHGEKSR